jgi:hypothetical protein
MNAEHPSLLEGEELRGVELVSKAVESSQEDLLLGVTPSSPGGHLGVDELGDLVVDDPEGQGSADFHDASLKSDCTDSSGFDQPLRLGDRWRLGLLWLRLLLRASDILNGCLDVLPNCLGEL